MSTDLIEVPTITIDRRQIVCRAVIDAEPIPWARAGRGIRGQSYTPKRYAEHRTLIAWAMHEGRTVPGPLAEDLGVMLTFYRSTRRHVDIDNLAKAVLDAGTDVVWGDDAFVTWALLTLGLDRDLPRTELVVFRRAMPVLDGPTI